MRSAPRGAMTAALALMALTVPTVAQADPSWVLSSGLFGAYMVDNGDPAAGAGVEVSLLHFGEPMSRNALLEGVVLQLAAVARNDDAMGYAMLGGELAYGGLGVELGAYGETAAGGYGAAVGAHLAAYLSLGFVYVSGGINLPFWHGVAAQESSAQPFVLAGFKVPITVGGSNPYSSLFNFNFGRGRPLVHDGAPVVAARVEDASWIDDLTPEVNPLSANIREALAMAWLDDALAEHASIAAFTRVSMQLLAVGAPPELVAGAHTAALDEVRHARLCFTLASMYGARWEAPGALSPDAIRNAACDRASIAREALLEGCLGEGVAAAIARAACATVEDPEVLRVLEVIADDEKRHAELAWSILGWCLSTGGADTADAVAVALGAIAAGGTPAMSDATVHDETWASCGRLSPSRSLAVHNDVAAEVRGRAWQHPALAGRVPVATNARRGAPRSRKDR